MTNEHPEPTSRSDEPGPPEQSGSALRRLDTRSLQGLAHPLRIRLHDELTYRGPATATQLAERLGESSGATSYHLRQLAKAGFVEEDVERGTHRERWWRRVPGAIQMGDPEQILTDPTARAAVELLRGEYGAVSAQRRAAALATVERWPSAWHASVGESRVHLVLTADQATELRVELEEVLNAWKRRVRDRDLVPAAERDPELADVDVELVIVPLVREEQFVDPPGPADPPADR